MYRSHASPMWVTNNVSLQNHAPLTSVIVYNGHCGNTVGEKECILEVLISDIHFKALKIFLKWIIADFYADTTISGCSLKFKKSPSTLLCFFGLVWRFIVTASHRTWTIWRRMQTTSTNHIAGVCLSIPYCNNMWGYNYSTWNVLG